MIRRCDSCGQPYEAKRRTSRFCSPKCRVRASRGSVVSPLPDADSTDVADALRTELGDLQMADVYEGRVALGIARQLDNGTVVGAAYASLSKELDRRVDALRLKAERVDDAARVIKGRLEEKRARMA